jgi:Uma2 family endonuclease
MTTLTSHPQTIESVINKTAVTGEQLLEMGDIGRTELVKGKIIKLPPHEILHASTLAIMGSLLVDFVRKHKLGQILGGGVGIYTHRNPDTVRGVDVAFISNERMTQASETGFLDVAPELIVEIMSPSDRWMDIQEKLAEYFTIGVQLVWLVDPQLEQTHVYRSLDDTTRLTAEDTLTTPELLPGFSVPLTEIFEMNG